MGEENSLAVSELCHSGKRLSCVISYSMQLSRLSSSSIISICLRLAILLSQFAYSTLSTFLIGESGWNITTPLHGIAISTTKMAKSSTPMPLATTASLQAHRLCSNLEKSIKYIRPIGKCLLVFTFCKGYWVLSVLSAATAATAATVERATPKGNKTQNFAPIPPTMFSSAFLCFPFLNGKHGKQM